MQNRLGGWRAGGRRQAIPIEGSEFVEPCDTLLIAIGQKTVNDYLDLPVELDRWGAVKVDEHGMTSVEGLFAAGDFVIGASTVVEAVGLGRKTALEMDTWLMGRERRKLVVKIEPVEEPRRDRAWDFIPPQHIPMEPMRSRFDTLTLEAEKGYDQDLAVEEAKRCYLCHHKYEIDPDNCIYCRACIEVAPRNCIKLVSGIDIKDDGSYGELEETDRVGQGRRDLDRQQRVHPLRRLLHGLPDQMHLDHQERDLLSGRLRRIAAGQARWRLTSTT